MKHAPMILLSICAVTASALSGACAAASADEAAGGSTTFEERRAFYLRNLAHFDADAKMEWARGVWDIGQGDPHKYVLPPILARIALDPEDENAISAYRGLMEYDEAKGDRGLYHFAAYLRTRLYFQFRDVLPDDIVESNEYDAKHYFHIMTRGGTENHGLMQRTSGYLWSERIDEPETRGDRTVPWLRDWLHGQVRRWFHVGTGEYDSSTYYAFSGAGLLNLADYAEDPVMRDAARAGMDRFAAVQALKYFHGAHLGPESRGFAHQAVGARPGPVGSRGDAEFDYDGQGTITDWGSWLWFGGSAAPMPMDEDVTVKVGSHAVVVMALSDYEPHPVIQRLARKEVGLPFEVRGSKPEYYVEPDEHGHYPGGNKHQEYLFFNDEFAMGTLYSGDRGVRVRGTILPQTTMFKLMARDEDDVRAFGMGSGYHSAISGRSPFDQYHQKEGAAILVSHIDRDMVGDDEERRERAVERAIFGVPEAVGEPVERNGWYFWQVNRAFIAAHPLGDGAEWAEAEGLMPHRDGNENWRYLISPGRLTGWVVQAGQKPEYADFAAFQEAVLEKTRIDMDRFNSDERTVVFHSLEDNELKMRHTATEDAPGGKPEAWTNGDRLVFEDWPVFESPYLNIPYQGGMMKVSDGEMELTIDFTGERPQWSESPVR